MKPATAGGPYKVPRQHNGWSAAVLAVSVHALLLLFLWIGVSWQNNEPTEVQAEIWDMTVQDAAPAAPPEPTPEPEPEPTPEPEPVPPPVVKAPPPPPVEAPPTPKEPDIALERLKKKKLEEEKKLAEAKEAKQKKEAEEKLAKLEAKKAADKKAAEQKLAEQREQERKEKEQAEKDKKLAAEKEKEKKKAAAEKLAKDKADKEAKDKAFAAEMSRITGSAAKGSTGTAAQSTGGKVDGGYSAAIRTKVKSNLIYGGSDDSLTATYRITQLPTGEVIGVRKIKGSASPAYDLAIENAIAKSSPLPKKKDGTVEREIDLVFNLKEMH
ncbi:MAG: cell envelope integrity protein TolA [Duganella sp.]